jgi:gamma-glutamylcyclotransferase (GGCT)/AIG2-like uncharacterized protein YtfP
MARRFIFRDYRPGKRGQFTSEETFNRAQGQGAECHVHREAIEVPETNIDNLDELEQYEDYSDEDLIEYEFHGTGDTGRRR